MAIKLKNVKHSKHIFRAKLRPINVVIDDSDFGFLTFIPHIEGMRYDDEHQTFSFLYKTDLIADTSEHAYYTANPDKYISGYFDKQTYILDQITESSFSSSPGQFNTDTLPFYSTNLTECLYVDQSSKYDSLEIEYKKYILEGVSYNNVVGINNSASIAKSNNAILPVENVNNTIGISKASFVDYTSTNMESATYADVDNAYDNVLVTPIIFGIYGSDTDDYIDKYASNSIDMVIATPVETLPISIENVYIVSDITINLGFYGLTPPGFISTIESGMWDALPQTVVGLKHNNFVDVYNTTYVDTGFSRVIYKEGEADQPPGDNFQYPNGYLATPKVEIFGNHISNTDEQYSFKVIGQPSTQQIQPFVYDQEPNEIPMMMIGQPAAPIQAFVYDQEPNEIPMMMIGQPSTQQIQPFVYEHISTTNDGIIIVNTDNNLIY